MPRMWALRCAVPLQHRWREYAFNLSHSIIPHETTKAETTDLGRQVLEQADDAERPDRARNAGPVIETKIAIQSLRQLSCAKTGQFQPILAIASSPDFSSRRLQHLQPPREVIQLSLVQFEKSVGFLDNPRVDHRFAVDLRLSMQPLGHFEPVP